MIVSTRCVSYIWVNRKLPIRSNSDRQKRIQKCLRLSEVGLRIGCKVIERWEWNAEFLHYPHLDLCRLMEKSRNHILVRVNLLLHSMSRLSYYLSFLESHYLGKSRHPYASSAWQAYGLSLVKGQTERQRSIGYVRVLCSRFYSSWLDQYYIHGSSTFLKSLIGS